MHRLRATVVIMLVWLLAVFNVERFHEPINLASFVYVYLALIAALTVGWPSTRRLPLVWRLPVAFVPLWILKPLLGYPLLGAEGLPLTITEMSAIAVTALLAEQIAAAMDRHEESARSIASIRFGAELSSLAARQSEMYREVRRARQHDRPLTLVALSARYDGNGEQRSRIRLDCERAVLEHYLRAQLLETLMSEVKDCDIVATDEDRFVLVLPETREPDARMLGDKLAEAIRRRFGFEIQLGMATFPDQEVTMTGLHQRAIEALGRGAGSGNGSSSPATTARHPPTGPVPEEISTHPST